MLRRAVRIDSYDKGPPYMLHSSCSTVCSRMMFVQDRSNPTHPLDLQMCKALDVLRYLKVACNYIRIQFNKKRCTVRRCAYSHHCRKVHAEYKTSHDTPFQFLCMCYQTNRLNASRGGLERNLQFPEIPRNGKEGWALIIISSIKLLNLHVHEVNSINQIH